MSRDGSQHDRATSSRALVRPPLQQRSQDSFRRVLEAGLEVLQEKGFEGFTLQEVSRRSGVSVGSIYERVPGREDLLLAIYENAMAWTADYDQLERDSSRDDLAPRERIELVVTDVAQRMLSHGAVLNVFMRQAPMDSYIWQRGAERSQATAKMFTRALLERREDIGHPEPEIAVDVAFRMVYCTVARRITHGPDFESKRKLSNKKLVGELARAVADYLLGPHTQPQRHAE